MTEYKIGKATVRMHGTPNRENLEDATAKFLTKVVQQRRKAQKEKRDSDERRDCV